MSRKPINKFPKHFELTDLTEEQKAFIGLIDETTEVQEPSNKKEPQTKKQPKKRIQGNLFEQAKEVRND